MMASRALVAAARRAPARSAVVGGRAPRSAGLLTSAVRRGGGPPSPPYQQTRPPNSRVVEEHELIWDDGVAAETCLDFDAAHVENGLAWWLGGFGFFATLATCISFYDPAACNRVTPRTDLYDPVAVIKAGDDDE